MPPLLAAVVTELRALEGACAEAERALMQADWSAFDQAARDQRRLTHALQNAMFAAEAERTPEFDEKITRRLQSVYLVRENQIQRIRQYQERVSKRLSTISKWKNASRSMLSGYKPKRGLASLDVSR